MLEINEGENAADGCSPNPCQNNQRCEAKSGGKFKCSCKLPFKGDFCEKSPCNPNPCKNDGNCSISFLSAKCSCMPGYKGDKCTGAECNSTVCKNGGTCKVVNNKISCGCVSSYSGPYCETKKGKSHLVKFFLNASKQQSNIIK
nr:adhesive plaque matrix protein 2 isoform X2 [Parasteatoda tepidariorum]